VPKLTRTSGEKAVHALQRLGFTQVRQRGSHVVLRKDLPEGAVGCVIPLHREVAVGTLRAALRQAGVTPEEFMAEL